MRIVKEAFLLQVAREYPKAASFLEAWRKIVRLANWRDLIEVRRTYPATDAVKVESGRQVLVFNVCGNDYRLIVAAHFNRQIVYTLRFLTHAEYSKNRWKDTL
jgi:mRNA interferase HigB